MDNDAATSRIQLDDVSLTRRCAHFKSAPMGVGIFNPINEQHGQISNLTYCESNVI